MHDQATSDAGRCPACGASNPGDANFCQECGTPLTSPQAANSADTVTIRAGDLIRGADEDLAAPELPRHMVAFKTDIGRKHHTNQDAGGSWTWSRPDGVPATLLVVADGVSAGRKSEEASRQTVKILHDRISSVITEASSTLDDALAALVEAVKEANHEVSARPHQAVANADATTVVAAIVLGNEAVGAWVGDTRIYRVRGDRTTRLTRDHSWAESVVSSGLMSAEQASRDPRAHMILRWLGPPDQEDPGIEVFRADLEPNDVILCCTDGLYMYFAPPASAEDEMAQVIDAHAMDLEAAAETLVRKALERGGYDNITAAALRVVGGSPPQHEPPGAGEVADEQPGPRADQTVQLRFPS
jgi:serine/threonine protein phosphatase PrpC